MRTRRSPRNQEILWRALGGEPPKKHDSTTVESLTRQLATPGLSKRSRGMIERDLERAKRKAV